MYYPLLPLTTPYFPSTTPYLARRERVLDLDAKALLPLQLP